jgi:hypothetical protein
MQNQEQDRAERRFNMLHDFGTIASKYPGALDAAARMRAIAELTELIPRGRYLGWHAGALSFRSVAMRERGTLFGDLCVECDDLTSGSVVRVAVPTFIEHYQLYLSDPALI